MRKYALPIAVVSAFLLGLITEKAWLSEPKVNFDLGKGAQMIGPMSISRGGEVLVKLSNNGYIVGDEK